MTIPISEFIIQIGKHMLIPGTETLYSWRLKVGDTKSSAIAIAASYSVSIWAIFITFFIKAQPYFKTLVEV